MDGVRDEPQRMTCRIGPAPLGIEMRVSRPHKAAGLGTDAGAVFCFGCEGNASASEASAQMIHAVCLFHDKGKGPVQLFGCFPAGMRRGWRGRFPVPAGRGTPRASTGGPAVRAPSLCSFELSLSRIAMRITVRTGWSSTEPQARGARNFTSASELNCIASVLQCGIANPWPKPVE